VRFSPLFDKACPESYRREGKGRFSNRMTPELYSELLGQDTRKIWELARGFSGASRQQFEPVSSNASK